MTDPAAPTEPPAAPEPTTPEPVRDPEAVLAKNTELVGKLSEAKTKLAQFEAEAETRRVAALNDHEKAIETAVASAVETNTLAHNQVLLTMTILQRSTGRVTDPDVAAQMIDTEGIEYTDHEAIDKAIEAFLVERPNLAVKGKRRSIDQGPQGHTPDPTTANDWLRDQIGR